MISPILKKALITGGGFFIILIGIALLVLPGPGIVLILAGLALLGREYHWARRLIAPAKEWYERQKAKAKKKADRE